MADELFMQLDPCAPPTPDKVVTYFRDLKTECLGTYQFEAAMQLEMMARTVEQLNRDLGVAQLTLNELNIGLRVVLPKSREHAQAMSLVASNYLSGSLPHEPEAAKSDREVGPETQPV